MPRRHTPVPLLGHSRGVRVDQNTLLDPCPIDGVRETDGAGFNDEAPAGYGNVIFVDDYRRADATHCTGEFVPGSVNGDLAASVWQAIQRPSAQQRNGLLTTARSISPSAARISQRQRHAHRRKRNDRLYTDNTRTISGPTSKMLLA